MHGTVHRAMDKFSTFIHRGEHMSVPSEHRISNMYLLSGDITAESRFGHYGGEFGDGVSPSSTLYEPAAENAPANVFVNVVARERDDSFSSNFLWAGDGI